MAVAKIAVDAAPANDVLKIIRVGEGETPQDAKVGLDEIEPGCLGRSEDRADS